MIGASDVTAGEVMATDCCDAMPCCSWLPWVEHVKLSSQSKLPGSTTDSLHQLYMGFEHTLEDALATPSNSLYQKGWVASFLGSPLNSPSQAPTLVLAWESITANDEYYEDSLRKNKEA